MVGMHSGLAESFLLLTERKDIFCQALLKERGSYIGRKGPLGSGFTDNNGNPRIL